MEEKISAEMRSRKKEVMALGHPSTKNGQIIRTGSAFMNSRQTVVA